MNVQLPFKSLSYLHDLHQNLLFTIKYKYLSSQ